MDIPPDPFSTAEISAKRHCIYCEHHTMSPSGQIGWGTCNGNGDIEHRLTMAHQTFDLLVGYYFGDTDIDECSKFEVKNYSGVK